MPQIYVILDSYLAKTFRPGEALDVFIQSLPRVVERHFDIEGRNDNDIAITIIQALKTVGEANIQIEIRYTAGSDEYGTGEIFDPSSARQIALIEGIHKLFKNHPGFGFNAPALTLSVWCKPYRGGEFKMFR